MRVWGGGGGGGGEGGGGVPDYLVYIYQWKNMTPFLLKKAGTWP